MQLPFRRKTPIDQEFQVFFEQPRGRLRRFFRIAFPFINLGIAVLVIWFAMTQQGDYEIGDVVGIQINWWWIVLGIGFFYLAELIECVRTWMVMRTTVGYNRLGLSAKSFLLSKHYDNLTPFSGGGKPYQLYYFHKNGLNLGHATTMLVSNYIIGRIGFQLATGIPLIFLFQYFGELGGRYVVFSMVVWGIVFNVGLTIVLVSMAFSRRLPKATAAAGIWGLHKVKIVKDKQKVTKAFDETLWQYRVTMRKLLKRPVMFASFVGLSTISMFMHICIIIFIYLAVGGNDPSSIPLLLLGIILTWYTALSTPIPGGTGAMELFFVGIFSVVFGTPAVFIALVIFKVFNYILPIVNGIPIILWDAYRDRQIRIDAKKVITTQAVE